MNSVLNEKSAIGAIADMFDSFNKFVGGNKRRESTYLNGSISRFTKNLLMTFPVLCDSSISIETAMTISKANERNVADMLQMLFAAINVQAFDNQSAADILGGLYKGLDPNMDINELIDLLDNIAGGSEYTPILKHEEARVIREMIEEFRKAKPFPQDSFSEKSLNEYVVKQVYNQVVVSEAPSPFVNMSHESDKYEGERPGFNYQNIGQDTYGRDIYKYINIYDTLVVANDKSKSDSKYANAINIQKQKDQNLNNEIRNKRDAENDMRQRQLDMINMNQRRLTANDLKKANEMQPLLITVNYNIVEKVGPGGKTNVIDRKSFLAGVKSRLIPVDGIDIIERFASKNRTALNFKNFIRATTGEIDFVKDFLLCLDQAKLDAKNAAKRGAISNIWHILEKRGAKNNLNKMKRKGNDATCITSVVISQENVNYMKTAYKFDLEDINNAKMIMDSYNLLALFIADESTEILKAMYDGNNEFENLSFLSLDRELSERNYRKMINFINQQGR